jgi:hypothetical protein
MKLNTELPRQQQIKQEAFHQQLGLKFKEENVKFCIRKLALYGAETWTLRHIDKKYVGKFEKYFGRRM